MDTALKEYIDNEIKHLNTLTDEKFAGRDTATKAALDSAQTAVNKAEAENRKWRDSANEWRGAMSDRERDFLTRKEFYAIVATVATLLTIYALVK